MTFTKSYRCLDDSLFYPYICSFQRTPELVPIKVYKSQNHIFALVGLTGLEPVTLRLSSACSNQLSYRPIVVSLKVTLGYLSELGHC
jgi:hypothetical protein